MNQPRTNCLNCRTPLAMDDQWCPECGTRVHDHAAHKEESITSHENRCPDCTGSVDVSDDWCASCGTRLSPNQSQNIPASNPVAHSVPPMPPSTEMPLLPVGGRHSTESSAPASLLKPLGSSDEVTNDLATPHTNLPLEAATTTTTSADATAMTARRGWNAVLACHTCENCFAQDVKDAPSCYKCGARFLTLAEVAAIQTEESKTDLDKTREKAQATVIGIGSKVSAARQTLNAAGQETLQAATETRAGRDLKKYWVGWTLVATTIFLGVVVLSVVIRADRNHASVPNEPLSSLPLVQVPATTGSRATPNTAWGGAYDSNADARQQSEAGNWNRAVPPGSGGVTMPTSIPVYQPLPSQNTVSEMQRDQAQQLRDMEARNQKIQEQQEQQLQQLQRQAEANQMVEWRCTRCQAKRYLPKSANEPPREEGKGTCVDLYKNVSPAGHSWTYGGPVR